MPKKPVKYDGKLSLEVETDLRIQLVAISYLRQSRGAYAGVVREFIVSGIRSFVAGLSPALRSQYDEILTTLRTTEGLSHVTE